MQIKLTARHDHPSEAARKYAEAKLSKLDRRLHDLTLVEVTFSRERNPSIADDHTVEAVVHTKGPHLVRTHVGGDLRGRDRPATGQARAPGRALPRQANPSSSDRRSQQIQAAAAVDAVDARGDESAA